ncbi:Dynamin-like GTPase that mediates homotypic ER fusion [Massospora cicadina]|nr:Dynamin-like GTPase that mediates homotypic ER fusion [Massospora cicadina]
MEPVHTVHFRGTDGKNVQPSLQPKLTTDQPSNGTPSSLKQTDGLANPQLQIIDENQVFNPELDNYMSNVWNLSDSGFNYSMVAVFGSQSTGKSTLLNALFGTNFDTMADTHRQQTTKGLWASIANGSNILVMDVEGVDGRERGEDQDFERRSALFSLAVSQVLLVNLWESQIGLYNGANMGLLRTVFEVNLELFRHQGRSKTLLLFVIRDHIGKVPLPHLAETIKLDLQRAWSEIAKPKGMERCDIGDHFDLTFFGLPHKVLLPDAFDDQVQVMRRQFYDPTHRDYVFRAQYHKKIPADGFAAYAASIWEQIVANRDLDLPTQQQLLAQFRCDEIAAHQFQTLRDGFTARDAVEAGEVVVGLGNMFRSLKSEAMDAFDRGAGRYNAEVYNKKRAELNSKIDDYFRAFFNAQLVSILRQVFDTFARSVEAGLKEPSYDFMSLTGGLAAEAKRTFVSLSEDLRLEGAAWTFAKALDQLTRDLAEFTAAKCQTELTKRETALARQVAETFEETIPPLLEAARVNMWEEVTREFLECATAASAELAGRAQSFGLGGSEVARRSADMRVEAWKALLRRLKDELADALLLSKLRRRLEEQFRYDAEGLPRVWRPADDIDRHFKLAKAEATELIPFYAKVRVDESKLDLATFFDGNSVGFDVRRTLTLVSLSKRADVEARFKREAEALFLEAKRSIVSTTSEVPYWVLVLVLVLGWNEILYVLTNPLSLVLLVTGGVAFYALYVTNLLGPTARALELVSRELLGLARKAMAEANRPPAPRLPRGPRPARRERRHRQKEVPEAWDERAETFVESSKESSSSISPSPPSRRGNPAAGVDKA